MGQISCQEVALAEELSASTGKLSLWKWLVLGGVLGVAEYYLVLALPWGWLPIRPSESQLALLIFSSHMVQVVELLLFAVLLGAFIHRYPEPYFVLWYLAWLAWLGLYASKVVASEFVVQNPLVRAWANYVATLAHGVNSGLFLLAASILLAPVGRTSWLRNFPPPVDKTIGAPVIWLWQYLRLNHRAIWIIAVPVLIAAFQCPYLPAESTLIRNLQSWASVLSAGVILALAAGIHQHTSRVSTAAANACLVVYLIYVIPQVNLLLAGDGRAPTRLELLGVYGPAMVLKPALALFMVLIALRETSAGRDAADRERLIATERAAAILDNLPEPCFVVRGNIISHANAKAQAILGVRGGETRFDEVFGAQEAHQAFRDALTRSTHGHLSKYRAELINPAEPVRSTPITMYLEAVLSPVRMGSENEPEVIILAVDPSAVGVAEALTMFFHDVLKQDWLEMLGRLRQADPHLPKSYRTSAMDALEHMELEMLLFLKQLIGKEVADSAGVDLKACINRAWIEAKMPVPTPTGPVREVDLEMIFEPDRTIRIHYNFESWLVAMRCVLRLAANAARESTVQSACVRIHTIVSHAGLVIRIEHNGHNTAPSLIKAFNAGVKAGYPQIDSGLIITRMIVSRGGGSVRIGQGDRGSWTELRLPKDIIIGEVQ